MGWENRAQGQHTHTRTLGGSSAGSKDPADCLVRGQLGLVIIELSLPKKKKKKSCVGGRQKSDVRVCVRGQQLRGSEMRSGQHGSELSAFPFHQVLLNSAASTEGWKQVKQVKQTQTNPNKPKQTSLVTDSTGGSPRGSGRQKFDFYARIYK